MNFIANIWAKFHFMTLQLTDIKKEIVEMQFCKISCHGAFKPFSRILVVDELRVESRFYLLGMQII